MDMKSGLSRAIKDAAHKKRRPLLASKATSAMLAVAQWHYDRACEAWDTYQHCLDDQGLFHPDFIPAVKSALNDFHRHIAIGDKLLRA
jgi:hypothetical protein